MFTGIIEEVGRIVAIERHHAGARLTVGCELVLSDISLGASVAVNGVCLTAVGIGEDWFAADLAPETLDRSNLGDLEAGSLVNLERPMRLDARLSGHIVQGHVDATGVLESFVEVGDGNWELKVRVPEALQKFLVYKGSICLDGISLTVADVAGDQVRVAVIPHTVKVTNLGAAKPGARINVECDILAKHVDKLLARMTNVTPD